MEIKTGSYLIIVYVIVFMVISVVQGVISQDDIKMKYFCFEQTCSTCSFKSSCRQYRNGIYNCENGTCLSSLFSAIRRVYGRRRIIYDKVKIQVPEKLIAVVDCPHDDQHVHIMGIMHVLPKRLISNFSANCDDIRNNSCKQTECDCNKPTEVCTREDKNQQNYWRKQCQFSKGNCKINISRELLSCTEEIKYNCTNKQGTVYHCYSKGIQVKYRCYTKESDNLQKYTIVAALSGCLILVLIIFITSLVIYKRKTTQRLGSNTERDGGPEMNQSSCRNLNDDSQNELNYYNIGDDTEDANMNLTITNKAEGEYKYLELQNLPESNLSNTSNMETYSKIIPERKFDDGRLKSQ